MWGPVLCLTVTCFLVGWLVVWFGRGTEGGGLKDQLAPPTLLLICEIYILVYLVKLFKSCSDFKKYRFYA